MTYSTFSFDWLKLREDMDHRSRSTAPISVLLKFLGKRETVQILDLGGGTGSNMRYLSKQLGALNQRWTILDQDQSLLSRITNPSPKFVKIIPVQGNIATKGLQLIQRADLVTGSALLDLTSEKWLRQLAESATKQDCPVFFALSYTGKISWFSNEDRTKRNLNPPDHQFISNAINRHQQRDKGTGPALGPSAVHRLIEVFQSKNYYTKCWPSHWILDHQHFALKRSLIEGWTKAALEESPSEKPKILSWSHSCLELAESSGSILEVSHSDLLALPKNQESALALQV